MYVRIWIHLVLTPLFFKDGVQLKKTQQVDEIMLSESVPDSEKNVVMYR